MLVVAVIVILYIPFFPNSITYIKTDTPQITPEEHIIQGVNDPLSSLSTRKDINHVVDILSAKYGQNPLIIKRIIQCESGYNVDAVNRKAVVGRDIGLLQINTYYHIDNAKKIGYDIYNPNDNLVYGFILMKRYGLSPWTWSKNCWDK